MKEMKREKVDIPKMKRKSVASKKPSWGIIAACIGVMIATVAKGIQLDKKEAESKDPAEDANQDNQ